MSKIVFANLSVTFGQKELLDYKEIISAAFMIDTHVRKYGKTRYHFLDTKLEWTNRDDPLSLVISGRFIKDTVLQREQVLSGTELLQDKQSMRSSPSAFFVFFLADHRLAFVPETSHAPTLGNFSSTIEYFIKQEFKKFIDDWYKSKKEIDKKYTRKMAFKDHVPPAVSLVPLTSRESIDLFMERFSKIGTITIHIIKRNQDMDGSSIFEQLFEKSVPLEPTSAKFVASAKKDGLIIDEAKELIIEATAGGYEQATINGEDDHGAVLNGSNEDFKLSVNLDLDGVSEEEKTKLIVDAYNNQKDSGNIKVTPRNAETVGGQLQELKADND